MSGVDLEWLLAVWERAPSDFDETLEAVVAAINAELAKARGEQQEVDARRFEAQMPGGQVITSNNARHVRDASLTATPLADENKRLAERIAELENGEPTRCDALVSENAKLRDAVRKLKSCVELYKSLVDGDEDLRVTTRDVLAETEWVDDE